MGKVALLTERMAALMQKVLILGREISRSVAVQEALVGPEEAARVVGEQDGIATLAEPQRPRSLRLVTPSSSARRSGSVSA